MKIAKLVAFCVVVLLLASCKKQPSSESAPNNPSTTAAPSTASAPTAATGSAPAAAPSSDGTSIDETASKITGTEWALKQDAIKHDPNGQWATDATASSSYNDAKEKESWSPLHATGEPDVERYGDDGRAWTAKTPDGGIEWLDLKYAKPMHGTEIRIRESCGSGAVVKVEAFDEAGSAHAIWQGVDPTKELNYFVLKFPKTAYKIARVKLTLATNIVPGWNEIDAVQLVGTE